MKHVIGRDTYVERDKGESSNDRNDRAIRQATKWYQGHLQEAGVKVVLLTNDTDNRQKAKDLGLLAFTGTCLYIINSDNSW